MGLFTRLSGIVSANLHGLLDSVEDPEKMLAQVVREMEEGLTAARQQAARAIAVERRLERELSEHRAAVQHCHDQARRALTMQREDAARQALLRKHEHETLAGEIEAQHAAALATSQEVRAALQSLEARLGQVRRRFQFLLAQHSAAQVRREVARLAGVAFDGSALLARFEHFEGRLLDNRDLLLSQAELATPCRDIDMTIAADQSLMRVNAELAEMKRVATG